MKRGLVLLAAVALAAPLCFWFSYRTCLSRDCDEMTWMTHEFKLTAPQRAAIAKLKADYEPVCEQHCEEIAEARRLLAQSEKNSTATETERQQARAHWNALSAECREATRKHVEAIAAAMSPDQGKRYLTLVLQTLDAQAGNQTPAL